MSQSLTINFAQPLPIFPLPNCVLLPHATIPLHIFEPRYRRMTRDALDGGGLIAMALFEGQRWKHEYEGKPPIRPVVCIGYITRHDQTDDGRFHLLLQGICRARIVRELEHDPYRRAILEPLETTPTLEIDLGEQRQRIEKLLSDPLLGQLSAIGAIHKWLTPEAPTAVVVDLAIMAVCEDVEHRYGMLAEASAPRRARWLEDRLRQTRKTMEIASRFEPDELPDHLHLN